MICENLWYQFANYSARSVTNKSCVVCIGTPVPKYYVPLPYEELLYQCASYCEAPGSFPDQWDTVQVLIVNFTFNGKKCSICASLCILAVAAVLDKVDKGWVRHCSLEKSHEAPELIDILQLAPGVSYVCYNVTRSGKQVDMV